MTPREGLKKIIEGVSNVFSSYSATLPQFETQLSPRGELVLDLNGYRVSSLVDQEYFELDWFKKPGQLEVIVGSEKIARESLRDSPPRVYSGLYPFSHIHSSLQKLFENAKKSDVKLDLATTIGTILHDAIEDEPRVRQKYKEWEAAVVKSNFESRESLEYELKELRLRIRDKYLENLLTYVPESVSGKERVELERAIRNGIDLAYHLTRFTDKYAYPVSMGIQLRRIENETPNQTFRRAIIKLAEKRANIEETGLMIPEEIMKQLYSAWNDQATNVNGHNLGKTLQQLYGKISPRWRQMPPAMMVDIVLGTIPIFHFFNETVNGYGRGMAEGIYGKHSLGLLKLSLVSRDTTIDAVFDPELRAKEIKDARHNPPSILLNKALSLYEQRRDIRKAKPEVDKEIAMRIASTYYDRLTDDGTIRSLLRYDSGGRRIIESLDDNPAKRLLMYSAARDFEVELPAFKTFYDPKDTSQNGKPKVLSDSLKYDAKSHKYFTLANVDEALTMLPDHWTLIAQLQREMPTLKVISRYSIGL